MCQSDGMKRSSEIKAYLLASRLRTFQNKVQKAIKCVKTALDGSKNAALSFSSGKDSVVLLNIAIQAGFCGKLVFFKYGIITDVETPQENIELLKYYAKAHGLEYNVLDCLGEVDCWEQCGRFVLVPETSKERTAFRHTNYDFAKQSKKFETENGIDLNLIGMRKDESKRRKAVLNTRGAIYQTKARDSVTCCPLLNFSDDDIWAYIFSENLKYLSIYDYPYIDRRKNRNEITMLYNQAILENGMLWHYKQMYPGYFQWIENRWGRIA